MTEVAIIVLVALIFNYLFGKIGLPGILGMMVAGVLMGPSGFDLVHPEVKAFLKEFKTLALIIILIRAGLGISKQTLNRIGGPAIRMSFIPCIIEGSVVASASYYFLDLPIYGAGMLGFIIAAVSPAVVVPTMLFLKEHGYGKNKEVPTLVLAGASLDDVFAITIFSVFAGLAGGASANWTFLLLGVPAGIVLGALIGALIGMALVWYFKKFHLRDSLKVILFLIIAVVFYEGSEMPIVKENVPVAALLGIMAIGFVLLEKYDVLVNRLAFKFNRLWVMGEILLFVYIGTEVQLSQLNASIIGLGLLILFLGLAARSLGVWISLLKSELNTKEKLFCMIAYWPKATVQAAMGAVPLTLITQGKINTVSIDQGQLILAMAVLAIISTAPLGAIGIKIVGPKFLEKS